MWRADELAYIEAAGREFGPARKRLSRRGRAPRVTAPTPGAATRRVSLAAYKAVLYCVPFDVYARRTLPGTHKAVKAGTYSIP